MNNKRTKYVVSSGLLLIAAIVVAVGVTSSSQGDEQRTKEEYLQNEEARRSAAVASATPGVFGPTSSIVFANDEIIASLWPTPEGLSLQAGDGFIVNEGQAPFPGQFYEFNNSWVMKSEAVNVHVWVGNLRAEGAGVVKAWHTSPSGETARYNFITPYGGSLRITEATGRVLVIQAESEDVFYLNTTNMELTDEDGNPVPSLTASPTPSPYPTLNGTPPFELPASTAAATTTDSR